MRKDRTAPSKISPVASARRAHAFCHVKLRIHPGSLSPAVLSRQPCLVGVLPCLCCAGQRFDRNQHHVFFLFSFNSCTHCMPSQSCLFCSRFAWPWLPSLIISATLTTRLYSRTVKRALRRKPPGILWLSLEETRHKSRLTWMLRISRNSYRQIDRWNDQCDGCKSARYNAIFLNITDFCIAIYGLRTDR